MYSFGAGSLFSAPSASGSTPLKFGALQDVTIDFSFNTKELYGGYQFPLAVARGTGKVTGKAKAAVINGLAFNNLFFGQTLATGETAAAVDEAGTVPSPSGPYTITVSNSATFLSDNGVVDMSTGLQMTQVASAPATGQYSVAAGVYTFAAADAGKAVTINYLYTVAASGKKIVINNQLLGTTPVFQATFTTTYLNKKVTFVFPNCVGSKLAFATKLEDFVIPEYDFSVFANAAGVIGTLSFNE